MLKQSLQFKLEKLAERQQEIHALLADPAVIKNQNRFRDLSREVSEVNPVVECYHKYQSNVAIIKNAKELLNDEDKDIRTMAEERATSKGG